MFIKNLQSVTVPGPDENNPEVGQTTAAGFEDFNFTSIQYGGQVRKYIEVEKLKLFMLLTASDITDITASSTELNYNDITTLGLAEASKTLTFDSNGISKLSDNLKLQFGTSSDMQLYHDGTDSFLTNAIGTLKIATETSGVPVQIGHSTSEVTIGQNLTVSGNLTVNGTTTSVNSTVTTLDDPIITLGGDTAPSSDDNKDRGVEFRWHNGSSAKLGFFGYDDSTSKFTFIPDATNSSEVFSGSAGDVAFGGGEFTGDVILDNAKSLRLSELNSNGSNHISIKAPNSVTSDVTLVLPDGAGANGQALTTDGSGNLSWAAVSGFKTWSSKTSTFTAAVNNHYSIDTTSSAINVNLPQVSTTSSGESIVVKFRNGTNFLTLVPHSGNTIEGLNNLILTDSAPPGQSVTLVSNGTTAWEII